MVESAFLAMLLPNPKKYSRSFYSKKLTPFAFKRIKRIISDMYQYNRISEEQYFGAKEKLKNFYSTPEQVSEIDSMDSDSDESIDASDDEATEDSLDGADQSATESNSSTESTVEFDSE